MLVGSDGSIGYGRATSRGQAFFIIRVIAFWYRRSQLRMDKGKEGQRL